MALEPTASRVSHEVTLMPLNPHCFLGEDASFGLPPALSSNLEDLLAEKADRAKEREEENKLSPKVAVMKPILRFLQLLCENHNREMQNLLRDQVT